MLYQIICEQCGKPSAKTYKGARFCSRKCLNIWQKTTPWEKRIGDKRAEEIRQKRSETFKSDKNPSRRKDVAKKISDSLKKYLAENPRTGESNPFYGHHHTEEFKKNHSKNKKGKWAYNDDQYKKLCKNVLRGDQCPAWNGGSSVLTYGTEFNRPLKRAIKNLYDNKCAICFCGNKKLCIHHIDYDKKNSDINNLIALCVNCHLKTNHNRTSWTKFFEEIKKQEKDKNGTENK